MKIEWVNKIQLGISRRVSNGYFDNVCINREGVLLSELQWHTAGEHMIGRVKIKSVEGYKNSITQALSNIPFDDTIRIAIDRDSFIFLKEDFDKISWIFTSNDQLKHTETLEEPEPQTADSDVISTFEFTPDKLKKLEENLGTIYSEQQQLLNSGQLQMKDMHMFPSTPESAPFLPEQQPLQDSSQLQMENMLIITNVKPASFRAANSKPRQIRKPTKNDEIWNRVREDQLKQGTGQEQPPQPEVDDGYQERTNTVYYNFLNKLSKLKSPEQEQPPQPLNAASPNVRKTFWDMVSELESPEQVNAAHPEEDDRNRVKKRKFQK